jgi:hypothetical protein
MALQSTARRAEAPPKTASVTKANSAPDVEPVSAAASPTRRPRVVAGKRTVASTNSDVAGRSTGANGGGRERPANETTAAPAKVAQASQKDADQQVTPEDSNPPPQQQGRPPAQRGRPAAGPASVAVQQATPQAAVAPTSTATRPNPATATRPAQATAPVVRTASAPRAAPAANELSRDELRAYLSAVEAQVRAALRQVDAQSKEVQQAHTALRADLSAALINLQTNNKDSIQLLEGKIDRLVSNMETGFSQNRMVRFAAAAALLILCILLGALGAVSLMS